MGRQLFACFKSEDIWRTTGQDRISRNLLMQLDGFISIQYWIEAGQDWIDSFITAPALNVLSKHKN